MEPNSGRPCVAQAYALMCDKTNKHLIKNIRFN